MKVTSIDLDRVPESDPSPNTMMWPPPKIPEIWRARITLELVLSGSSRLTYEEAMIRAVEALNPYRNLKA